MAEERPNKFHSYITWLSNLQIISVRELGDTSYLYQLVFLSLLSILYPFAITDVFHSLLIITFQGLSVQI